jgi:hypothetical protein
MSSRVQSRKLTTKLSCYGRKKTDATSNLSCSLRRGFSISSDSPLIQRYKLPDRRVKYLARFCGKRILKDSFPLRDPTGRYLGGGITICVNRLDLPQKAKIIRYLNFRCLICRLLRPFLGSGGMTRDNKWFLYWRCLGGWYLEGRFH